LSLAIHHPRIHAKRAAVPADLHFRNGRTDYNIDGRYDHSCLPFDLEFFHLLSAVSHNPVAAFAQAEPSQAGAPSDSINACPRTPPALLKLFWRNIRGRHGTIYFQGLHDFTDSTSWLATATSMFVEC
jgi:hypothetical protein